MKNITVSMAWLFAVIFMEITFIGCIANYLYGEEILSISCKIYSFIHITTAIGFAAIALLGEKELIPSMRTFGMIYMLVSLIGLLGMNLQEGHQWLDVISINALNYIEFGLGISLSVVGSMLYKRQRLVSCTA